MNYKSFGLGFIVGGAIGAAASYFFFKSKNEYILEKEINEVKEHYNEKIEQIKKPIETLKALQEDRKEENSTYKDIIENEGYDEGSIKVITEYEFTADDDYEKINIIRFEDGVLTYDDGSVEPIDNPESILGPKWKDNMPVDDNATYFRDEALKIDYEVLYDERRHKELMDGE